MIHLSEYKNGQVKSSKILGEIPDGGLALSEDGTVLYGRTGNDFYILARFYGGYLKALGVGMKVIPLPHSATVAFSTEV